MPEQPAMSAQETSADLADLPPSAKLVAKTLEYEGDKTQSDLAESTLLPPRTVRYALTDLEESGIVSSRISFMDARQRVYSLE
jgi:DNA-binding MarR family transcriptional regulator